MERWNEVRSLEKAINLLLCFTRADRELGLADLTRMTGLPKGTVHRIATVLTRRGIFGQEDRSRKYYLGSTLQVLGGLVQSDRHIKDAAIEVMRELEQTTSETVNLSVPRGELRVCIEMVDTTHEIRLMTFVGQTSPLHAGAAARALLAFMDEPEIEAVLAAPLQGVTDRTLVDPAHLRGVLAEVRRLGYAVSESERVLGAAALAAPVYNALGRVVASVGIAGPSYRLGPDRIHELIPQVLAAAQAISSRLGLQQ